MCMPSMLAGKAAADSCRPGPVLCWAATSFRSAPAPTAGPSLSACRPVLRSERGAHLPDVCRQLPHEHLGIQRTPKLVLQSICQELGLAATLDDGDRDPLGQLQGATASVLPRQTET